MKIQLKKSLRFGEKESVQEEEGRRTGKAQAEGYALRRFETDCGYCFCSSKLRNMAYCSGCGTESQIRRAECVKTVEGVEQLALLFGRTAKS